ncbi:hypothetical protein ABIE44_002116 [Marmoricola sp. OAE513]|uniref:hypothetical protein n=1 Tax=Marmoricola sp. OAE513 TaxID=2817894 RepID=UPI001AE39C0A
MHGTFRLAAVRLSVVAAVAVALVVATVIYNGTGGPTGNGADSMKKAYAAAAANNAAAKAGDTTLYNADGTHSHDPGAPAHDDNDPKTKNSVSRSAPTTDNDSSDPTTPAQAARSIGAAADQRNQKEPKLRNVSVDPAQPSIPTNRYNLFNACYGLKSITTGRWLNGLTFTASKMSGGSAIFFKPTSLGHYMLYTKAGTYLAGGKVQARFGTAPGPKVNWTVTQSGPGSFRLFLPGSGYLQVPTSAGAIATFVDSPNDRTQFQPFRRTGCKPFPEIGTGVYGKPAAGTTGIQETRGTVDAHTHGMAFEFLGGELHCGRPWSPWGVTVALKGCENLNAVTSGAVESFFSGEAGSDPVGWPTFKSWPAPDALTHEGTYYKWMERSWQAGQRVLVNLLVENNQLCTIYPIKRNSCDDMTSIRLQAKDMHLLENYIDAQHGGPGKGWYRIVTNPVQARKVVNAGKLAVVMGIETSVLFGCHRYLGKATCTKASIEKQLTEVRKMGVTQMELVNKFDNALAGVAGDEGTTGNLVNAANILETGSAWKMTTCKPNDPEVHDRDQNLDILPNQDALFGALKAALPQSVIDALPAVPVYPAKHHCNTLGLTELGAETIKGMAKRNMLFDPDHMSVKARKQSLDLVETMRYPGVVSSHSWSTPDAYPRIYDEKGFITPYAGDSEGFVEKWKRHLTWVNPKTYWGFGYGADINGLGAQGAARGADVKNPVKYPFTGLGGVKVYKQVSGKRTYDINKDGVAHYGMYPDWLQDLKMIAGPSIVKDMYRGSEAYLQTWERAYGVKTDACTSPSHKHSLKFIKAKVKKGASWWKVVKTVGQPHRRLGSKYTYCTKNGKVTVKFTKAGTVSTIRKS